MGQFRFAGHRPEIQEDGEFQQLLGFGLRIQSVTTRSQAASEAHHFGLRAMIAPRQKRVSPRRRAMRRPAAQVQEVAASASAGGLSGRRLVEHGVVLVGEETSSPGRPWLPSARKRRDMGRGPSSLGQWMNRRVAASQMAVIMRVDLAGMGAAVQ